MFSYIEQLRKAPLSKRREMAMFLTALIVGVIVIVWIISLIFRFSSFGTSKSGNVPNAGGVIEAPYTAQ